MSVFRDAVRLLRAWIVFIVPIHASKRSPSAVSFPHALQRTLAANLRLTAADCNVSIAGGGGTWVQAVAGSNSKVPVEVNNAVSFKPFRSVSSAETNLQLCRLFIDLAQLSYAVEEALRKAKRTLFYDHLGHRMESGTSWKGLPTKVSLPASFCAGSGTS